jgi:hypothetical protein
MKAVAVLLMVVAPAVLVDRPAGSETLLHRVEREPDQVVLHGRVSSVTDQSILLRTDDGRHIFVNLAWIPPAMVPDLTEGQRVVVLGTFGLSSASFIAQAIEPSW